MNEPISHTTLSHPRPSPQILMMKRIRRRRKAIKRGHNQEKEKKKKKIEGTREKKREKERKEYLERALNQQVLVLWEQFGEYMSKVHSPRSSFGEKIPLGCVILTFPVVFGVGNG